MRGTRSSITYGVRLLALGVILLTPSIAQPASAAPPDSCLVYAFTFDDTSDHYSLIRSESVAFGTGLTVVTNCEGEYEVSVDGMALFKGSNTSHGVGYDGFIEEMEIRGDGWAVTYHNLTLFQSGHLSDALYEYDPHTAPGTIPLSLEDISMKEVIASAGTGLIVWVIVTGFLYKAINAKVDRTFIEEVVQ